MYSTFGFSGVSMSYRAKLVKPVNDILRPLHMQLVRGSSPDPAVKDFLSARKTIVAAQKAGLPLVAYIDKTFATPGATPDTVRAMLKLADLPDKCATVCEIGPGSGRYAEEIIAALQPATYEIYETAKDWLRHLRRLPNVVVRDCDGHTLAPTREASVDLVHAHKVFVCLEFYVTAGYLAEMARVVRPGGAVAFDIVTEACLDDETVKAWTRDGSMYRPISRAWAVEFMQRRGLTLRGSHFEPLPPGTTELLVFHRD
jgi:SAM-dependent methyltransferase